MTNLRLIDQTEVVDTLLVVMGGMKNLDSKYIPKNLKTTKVNRCS